MLDQVSGNDSPAVSPRRSGPSGRDVRRSARDGRRPRLCTTGNTGADHAGEHITGARRGQRRAVVETHAEPPVGSQHQRVGPLQQGDGAGQGHEVAVTVPDGALGQDAVDGLRKAFEATLVDKALLAEADKSHMEITATTADEARSAAVQIVETKPDILAIAKQLIEGGSKSGGK